MGIMLKKTEQVALTGYNLVGKNVQAISKEMVSA